MLLKMHSSAPLLCVLVSVGFFFRFGCGETTGRLSRRPYISLATSLIPHRSVPAIVLSLGMSGEGILALLILSRLLLDNRLPGLLVSLTDGKYY